MMILSDQGEMLIKNFEGLRLNAYRDSASVWTIGYGSTHYHDGKQVNPGDKLANEKQADALFKNILGNYEDTVNQMVKVTLNQNQFDALVSFTYNVGVGTFEESTLLRKLNEKDYNEAANCFSTWNKITNPHTGKKVICDALVKRREAERKLFSTT